MFRPSQKTYLGLTGKGYKDCLQGPGHSGGRLEGLKVSFSHSPSTSCEAGEFAASKHVLPEGPLSSRPQMPPENELQRPDVSALTGFQERSAVLRSPHFLLHTHSLVLCGGKQEAFTPPHPHPPLSAVPSPGQGLALGTPTGVPQILTGAGRAALSAWVGGRLSKPRRWDPPPLPYPFLVYHLSFTSQTKDRPKG